MSRFDPEELVGRLRGGERRALAQALTAVENETPEGLALLRLVDGHLGHARVIGITGAPGTGKSSLIGACLGELLARRLRVAVVAVDPSSALTGGAILGDRVRMDAYAGDDRVFIRSLASRGHLGGLSRSTAWAVDVFDAAGYDVVIVETVGTGQSEIEIVDLAHLRVVVCAPGLGDEVQAIKAGILEIADLYVVNKADLPRAEQTVRQLEGMLSIAHRKRPVIAASATAGTAIDTLVDRFFDDALSDGVARDPQRRIRHLLARLAAERVHAALKDDDGDAMEALCHAVRRGELTFEEAVGRLLERPLE